MTVADKTTLRRLIDSVDQALDWFIVMGPDTVGPEAWRRRLLVIFSLGLFPVCLLFANQYYPLQRFRDSTIIALLVVSSSLLIPPFLLRLTHSLLLPSMTLLTEMVVILTFLIFRTGGFRSPALIWLALIPITAMVLVGTRWGMIGAGVVITDVIMLYLYTKIGYPFRQSLLLTHTWWLDLLSTLSFVIFVTLMLVFYERLCRKDVATLYRLSRAVEHSPSMVLIYDADGLIEYLNPKFLQTTGHSPEEFIGSPVSVLGGNTAEMNEQIRNTLSVSGGEWHGEFLNRKKYGEPYWVSVSISPVRNAQGIPTHFVEVQEDITVRKQAEEAARENLARLTAILELSVELTAIQEEAMLLDTLVTHIAGLAKSPACTLLIVDEPADEAVLVAQTGLPENTPLGLRVPLHMPIIRRSMEKGQPIIVPDVDRDSPELRSLLIRSDIQAFFAYPMVWRERVLGFITLSSLMPRHPSLTEVTALQLLAERAAAALENVRLFHETQRQAEELGAMVKVSAALRTAQSLTAMLPIILDEVLSLLDARSAALIMLHRGKGEKVIELAKGSWSGVSGLRIPLGQPATERLIRAEKPELKENASGDSLANRSDSVEDLFSAACVPLIAREETIGELWIGREEGITAGELQLLTAICDIAANAIQRVTLYEQTLSHTGELEKRVAERTAALSAANADLARAGRAKDEFLANMSHELRTPLSNILVRVELLQKGVYGQLASKQVRSLDTIDESSRHLLQLINDILDVSKIEAGRLELEIRANSVESLCQSSMQFIKESARQKQIELHTDIQSTVVHADGRRLKQILVNLLSNAVKFTPKGGRVGLDVSVNQDEESIRFSVWDTGVGIAKHDLRRLFQPFTQLDGGLMRKHEGTGLGLALVRRLTEMHRGSVAVESELEQGSRFTVSLPWYQDGFTLGEKDQMAKGTTVAPIFPPGKSATILLAEDNEPMIKSLTEYLALIGCRVVVARNGGEAIELARETVPNLILMDIQMPGIDGLEAIRQIRKLSNFKEVPIIALTALAMPGDRERCLEAGANEYLSKPISLGKLTRAVARHLNSVGEKETQSL